MQTPALKQHYIDEISPALKKLRGYSNKHELPALVKVVINSGIKATEEKNWVNEVAGQISQIAGQKAVITLARESISNFKLREGMPVGVKVTLRGDRMYDFLYRLINLALPIIRDFRGVPTKFDGRGNYTLGISDHTIFPEINIDGNKKNLGMDITIVTTAKTDEEGKELLEHLGMPFRKRVQTQ